MAVFISLDYRPRRDVLVCHRRSLQNGVSLSGHRQRNSHNKCNNGDGFLQMSGTASTTLRTTDSRMDQPVAPLKLKAAVQLSGHGGGEIPHFIHLHVDRWCCCSRIGNTEALLGAKFPNKRQEATAS